MDPVEDAEIEETVNQHQSDIRNLQDEILRELGR
jgi:hypothetical protein